MEVPMIVITGGEPLLHPQFKEIIHELNKGEFSVKVLQTNGTLINKDNLNLLKIFNIIQIGYDVPPPKGARSKPDFNDIIREKIELLKSVNIEHVVLFITLHKRNVKYLDEFISQSEQWNVGMGFNFIIPAGRAKQHPELWLSREEFIFTLSKLWGYYLKKKVSRPSDPLSIIYYKALQKKALKERHRIVGGCMAGISSLSITPEGSAVPCPFLRIPIGNINERKLKDIWNTNPVLDILRSRRFKGKCSNCEFINACGGCRARAYHLKGSLNDDDPYCPRGEISEDPFKARRL